MKQAGKPDIQALVDQQKQIFTYDDNISNGTTAIGSITMDNISAGSWNGLFNFNISANVDVDSVDSTASTIEDMLNIDGVMDGQDITQSKETVYSIITNN
ncbi:MAG TPA: hypothetical protein VJZ04_02740 [Lachnospiraceae bacterium]|nr:hypothetical protein [Lachnospiraceae bacterium]